MEVCDQSEEKNLTFPNDVCEHVNDTESEKNVEVHQCEEYARDEEMEKENRKPQVEAARNPSMNKLKTIDPWAVVDPQEYANKAAKDFVEQVASKEWYMRLRALDQLLALFNTYPRVAGLLNIEQISAVLVELLEKDAVMYVWIRCILIMLKIAEYMPDEFSKLIPEVMPIAFDKQKEKKAALTSKLNEFCDAVANMSSLDCYVDAVCGGLTHTSPHTKCETAAFLSRQLSPAASAESLRKILPCLVKCMHDADKGVRDASYRAVAALLRCMREPAIQILFSNVCSDKTRMDKINNYFEKMRDEKEGNRCETDVTSNSDLISAEIVSTADIEAGKPTTCCVH